MRLRAVERTDSDALLLWRNDARTRNFSINTEVITQDTHESWFSGILAADPVRIFILEDRGLPVGSVRRDFKDDGIYLSWMVNPEHRGCGIGEAMLALFLRCYPDHYKALIKEENTASIHIAQKCGFARVGEQQGLQLFQYDA